MSANQATKVLEALLQAESGLSYGIRNGRTGEEAYQALAGLNNRSGKSAVELLLSEDPLDNVAALDLIRAHLNCEFRRRMAAGPT